MKTKLKKPAKNNKNEVYYKENYAVDETSPTIKLHNNVEDNYRS